jgi:hypothetical protein
MLSAALKMMIYIYISIICYVFVVDLLLSVKNLNFKDFMTNKTYEKFRLLHDELLDFHYSYFLKCPIILSKFRHEPHFCALLQKLNLLG